MASSKAFVAKHGLAVNSPSTVVFGSNAKLHANNTITAGTITGAMLAPGAATDDTTVLATNTALRALITAEGNRNTLVNTNLTSTNTALRTLISDRLQVANATTLFLETGNAAGAEQSVGGQVTFSHNVIVSGNLTVSGTSTTVNTETIKLADNLITINSNQSGTPSENGGIEIERGSATNVAIRWNEGTDKWQFTNDGSNYTDFGAGGVTVQEEGSSLSNSGTTLNFVGTPVTASGTGATKTITISALQNLSEDTTPSLGGTLDTDGQLINFRDSGGTTDDRLNFGDSQDLSIYHTGSESRIENDTGILRISGTDIRINSVDQAKTSAFFTTAGGVTLQHDGSQKFETTASGINVTGTVEFDGLSGTGATTVTDILDEDAMGSNSATALATQQSIKAYVDANALSLIDEDNMSTNSATRPPSQQSVKAYVDAVSASITAADLTNVEVDTLLVKNPAQQHSHTVTVASKTSAHPYTGTGSSSAFFIDGKESPSLIFAPNMTYRFDQADNTNSSHPLRFYLDAAKTTAYTTGVTTNGTAGSSGAYTQIVVTDATPPVLYYQCSSHAHMGSVASSLTEGTTDHYTEGSTNLYYTNARADARIAAANISALNNVHNASPTDGQALVWDNSNSRWAPGTVGGSLTIQEEGSALSTAATTLNFVGSSVTASGSGTTKTITITGGAGGNSFSSIAVNGGNTVIATGATQRLNIQPGNNIAIAGHNANNTLTISATGTTIGANGNFGGDMTVATASGSATTFTSPLSTNLANNIIVSVDGLLQRPTTDYTVSGTTVTFGTAPAAGTAVMVRSFSGGLTNKAGINVQTFTCNGSNTVYKLADPVSAVNDVIVTVNGIVQRPTTDYTYANPNITFQGGAPASGDILALRTFNISSSGSKATVSDTAPTNPTNGDLWFDSTVAKMFIRYEDGSSNQWISVSVPGADGSDGGGVAYEACSSNVTLAKDKGYLVDTSAARTLTLPASATIGDEIRIIDATGQAGTNNITVARNSHKIQGDASNLTISTNRAAFGLVYYNAAQGWLLTER